MLCALSLLSNLCFFEKTNSLLSPGDLELRTVKASVLDSLTDYVIQTGDQQIQIESLRVLANVSRNKALVKQVEKTQLLKALLILLDSNDKEVVYYSLGILVNCTNEESILTTYGPQMYANVITLLDQCSLDELEIVVQSFKLLLVLVTSSNSLHSDEPEMLDSLLGKFTEDCDIILQYSDLHSQDNQQIEGLRSLLNSIQNNLSDSQQTPNLLCPKESKVSVKLGRVWPEVQEPGRDGEPHGEETQTTMINGHSSHLVYTVIVLPPRTPATPTPAPPLLAKCPPSSCSGTPGTPPTRSGPTRVSGCSSLSVSRIPAPTLSY